jgi:hypothetical protein
MDSLNSRQDINKYRKFKKVDGATYRKVNQFLRKRTYITAREWALARLCTDFRTSGGAEMTFIGMHLPDLVPFMEDTYTPQAVNQARNAFKKKVRKSSATFFYGAMCGFFTTDELDDLLFEASEVARFLLEVEGTTLDIDEEIDIEDRITNVMRGVGEAAKTLLKSRNKEERVKDQPERTDLSDLVSLIESPHLESIGSAHEEVLRDTSTAPATPEPAPQKPVPATTIIPFTEPEMVDEAPTLEKDPVLSKSTKTQESTETGLLSSRDKSPKTMKSEPSPTGITVPEKEDS